MKPITKRLLIVAAALAIALAIATIATAPNPPDTVQIAGQLEAAREAAERHSVNDVLSVVSDDYNDGELQNTDQLRFYLARAFRSSGRMEVSITQPAIDVQGDSAESVCHVTVTSRDDGSVVYAGDVTLNWKREQAKRYLVFPTTVWRIVSAQYPGAPSVTDY